MYSMNFLYKVIKDFLKNIDTGISYKKLRRNRFTQLYSTEQKDLSENIIKGNKI